MKNARAKRAEILFFIVKYANLWNFCCRRRRGSLSSLLLNRRTATWNQFVNSIATQKMKDGIMAADTRAC